MTLYSTIIEVTSPDPTILHEVVNEVRTLSKDRGGVCSGTGTSIVCAIDNTMIKVLPKLFTRKEKLLSHEFTPSTLMYEIRVESTKASEAVNITDDLIRRLRMKGFTLRIVG